MAKNISIDRLNEHLFESIEMLKNNKDPQASDNEKKWISRLLRAIADLGKVAIEGYKVKAQVLNMMQKTDNPKHLRETSIESGIFEVGDVKFLDQG